MLLNSLQPRLILTWSELGPRWAINSTVAQIRVLLGLFPKISEKNEDL